MSVEPSTRDPRHLAEPPAEPAEVRATGPLLPLRLVADLTSGVAYTVAELPHLVRDLRLLVAELTRAAKPGGELSALLAATAELTAARAAVERRRAGTP